MRMREVRPAMAARVATGSKRGLESRLSPTHIESRPAASARSANVGTSEASAGLLSRMARITNPRVARRTPILTTAIASRCCVVGQMDADPVRQLVEVIGETVDEVLGGH